MNTTRLLILIVLMCKTASASVNYSIIDLGDLGGGFGRSRAINNLGQVVGESLLPGQGIVERAFLAQNGTVVDLGTLGGLRSRAFDINDSGQVAGWAQNSTGNMTPALWKDGEIQALPTLGGNTGAAWSINNSGILVGNAYTADPGIYHATLWNAGAVTDLGTLGGAFSVAYGINSSGIIVGSASNSDGKEMACLWNGAEIKELGSLSGGYWNAAREVNDKGQMIFWGVPAGGSRNHAVFWNGDLNSAVIDLGTFGGNESWAYGLNNNGYVVGWAHKASGEYHAFLWDGNEKVDLGTLGGLSSTAYSINDEGVIAGYAMDSSGDYHAVMWVPVVPEPSTLILGCIGAGVMWFRFRRRK